MRLAFFGASVTVQKTGYTFHFNSWPNMAT
jgi:hypothetical protein